MSSKLNKDFVRRYFEAYDTGSIDEVMSFVDANHIHHPGCGEPLDYAERKRDDQVFLSAFSNIETVVEDQIADGDKVASRVTMRCTHSGAYHGIPPTGKRVTITFIDIAKVNAGKIAEEWVEFDMISILRQIRSDNSQCLT
jgi:predicted ester cyclase